MNAMNPWVRGFERASLGLSLIFLVVLFLLMLADAVLRAASIDFYWGSEGGGILMAWLIFFTLPVVGYRRSHIATDFLTGLLPPGPRWALSLVGHVLMLAYMLVLAWVCIELARRNVVSGARTQGILRLPLSVAQIGVSIGIVLMIASQCLVVVEEALRGPIRRETPK